jgi:hypothetical protein
MHTDSRITSSADQLVAGTARLRQALERLDHEAAEHQDVRGSRAPQGEQTRGAREAR